MLKLFKGARSKKKSPVKVPRRRSFRAVSINTKPGCCDQAAASQCERFLTDKAPHLPLDLCTKPRDCECTYEHFDDRRTERRRLQDQGVTAGHYNNERRHGPGRRATDGTTTAPTSTQRY